MPEQGRGPSPWLPVNGRRITVPADVVPAHLTPCQDCGRLIEGPGPDICGGCFGSVCDA